MKRNFNAAVKDFDGNPHVRPMYKHDEKGMPVVNERNERVFSHFAPITLRTYAIEALGGRWKGEESLSNDEMWKRMKLCDRLTFAGDGDTEITLEEGKLILDCLNKQMATPIVIGRMKDLIENDPEQKS